MFELVCSSLKTTNHQGIRAKREKVAESREAEARAAGIVVARKQRVEYGTGMKQGKGRSKDDSGPGKELDRNGGDSLKLLYYYLELSLVTIEFVFCLHALCKE